MSDPTGQVIKGYEVRELIGAGGFGTVYLAYQPMIGRDVAIKVILPEYANHPNFIRRFEVEAQLVARLEHPHIIPLYDYWREPDSAYLVMRYLRGGSLRDALHEKPWNPVDVVNLLDQISGALTVAHRAGVVHRDLKPDNILLDEDGNAYLADFGIAKDLRAHDETESEPDALVGSPAYLSPEQVMGEAVTTQADIYSFGVILYELLGGQHPFPDETSATLLLKHIQAPLPPLLEILPDIPPEVDEVVQRATAKNPGDRFSSARELAAAFREAFAISGTAQIGMAARAPDAIMVSGVPTAIELDALEIENPYKGLRPFQEADAADFFGRNDLVGHLIERLQEIGVGARFLAVVGPSGSGKSSVVKAGLIPALRQDVLPGSSNWFILEMTPGMQPIEELGTALLSIAIDPPPGLIENLYMDEYGLLNMVNKVLPNDGSELFLYIDQFEEIFTQTEDGAARVHFLNNLINAINDPQSRLRVVITLRADFYDRPLLYADFGNLVRSRTEVVLPLSSEELGDSIAGPAERVGIVLEDGLVGVIVNDVGDEVGALPLLQYALTELFERRQHNILTVSAYESSGGVLGALARRAEEIYTDLNVEQQESTRQMFLRLVTLGEGTEDTRRRILWSEITSIGNIQSIIDLFGKYRLLTFDHDPTTRSPTIEVAHEALIRRWERLREWLQNSREELRLQRRLTHAAEEWNNSRKDTSFLASGVRLAQFEAWASTTDLVMNREESEYLRASVAEHEAQEQLELERQMREAALERRSRNFLRALVVVMFFAVVIASGLMLDAINQRQIAENKATEAQSLSLSANARNALNEHDPSLALALAMAAQEVHTPPVAETQFILAQTAYGPGVRYHFADFDGSVLSAVFSPDGGHILSGAADHTVRLFDSATGQEVLLLGGEDGGHSDIVNDVAISPDGRYALSGSTDMSARLWDLESGAEIRRFGEDGLAHDGVVSVVAFSPDGQTAITGGYDHVIVLWDVESGEEIQRFAGHEGVILDAAFSPDGQFIVSGSADDGPADDPDDFEDRTVRVWDVATGEEIRRFDPDSGFVRAVAFSPDGQFVASGTWDASSDGTLQLWAMADESENPEPIRRFFGHSDPVTSILFTADGQRIISGSRDQTVRVWNVATGTEIDSFAGHADRVVQIALSADEQYLLASVGHIDDPRLEDDPPGDPGKMAVWVWDLLDRAQIQLFDDHTDWVWSADLGPDGRYAVSGSGPLRPTSADEDDYSVRVWDLESGAEVLRIDEHESTVNWVDFSPDGALIASGSWDGTARLWRVDVDAGTWEEAGRFDHDEYQVLTVAFSPDGQTLLSGGSCSARDADNACTQADILLWDVESGEVLRNFAGHTNSVNAVVFNPDGETFISASADQTLRLWDVETGEEIRVFEGHSAGVNNVAFSIDGGQILSSSWDGSARLWNVETGEEARQFVGHTGSTWGVAFTIDGLNVLTGGSDTTIRLWSLETGEEIRRFEGHTSWVLSLVFGPKGDFFISGAEDDTMRQWQMARTTEELMDWARSNRYIRELSCPERELYRVEPFCEAE